MGYTRTFTKTLAVISIFIPDLLVFSNHSLSVRDMQSPEQKEANRNQIEVTKHRDLALKENEDCKVSVTF